MNKDNTFPDRKIIVDLEKIIKKPLNHVDTVKWNSFGYELRNNKITGIGLYGSGISELPDSFWELLSLEKLSLVETRLLALSPLIENFSGLLELYIGGNGLTAVPKQIGTLKKLRYLYIHEENLLSLPRALASLTSLEELSIVSKKIKNIPDSFLSLKNTGCRIYLNNELV